MLENRSMPRSTVIPELPYPDVAMAAEWLTRAFGFTRRLMIANHRAQMNVPGGGALVVIEGGDDWSRCSLMIRVEDADAHCAAAIDAGARLLLPATTYPYGERQYTVQDFAGHVWTFSQSVADIDPASWGGQAFEL